MLVMHPCQKNGVLTSACETYPPRFIITPSCDIHVIHNNEIETGARNLRL
jgi:hypothetical protein